MRPTVKTSSPTDNTAKLRASLERIARQRVLVGVPEDDSARKGGKITNAQLVYLHTNGSDRLGIPARPIIEPAIEAADNRQIITGEMGQAARAVLDQQVNAANNHLEAAGLAGSNAAKRWFTDGRNGWAPDSPATARRKGSSRPLIDTAQMRRSITYVVEEK